MEECGYEVGHEWMSHFTHVSRRVCRNMDMQLGTNTNESYHRDESVMSHIHPHMNESCRACICIWMRHVAHISRRAMEYGYAIGHEYEWVLSRVWMSHVAHVSTYEWVMSHMYLGAYGGMWKWSWARIQMSLVTNMKVSFRTCICMWMSHVTHVSRRVWRNVEMKLGTNTNESCHEYESVISHMYLHMNESCHTCI